MCSAVDGEEFFGVNGANSQQTSHLAQISFGDWFSQLLILRTFSTSDFDVVVFTKKVLSHTLILV